MAKGEKRERLQVRRLLSGAYADLTRNPSLSVVTTLLFGLTAAPGRLLSATDYMEGRLPGLWAELISLAVLPVAALVSAFIGVTVFQQAMRRSAAGREVLGQVLRRAPVLIGLTVLLTSPQLALEAIPYILRAAGLVGPRLTPGLIWLMFLAQFVVILLVAGPFMPLTGALMKEGLAAGPALRRTLALSRGTRFRLILACMVPFVAYNLMAMVTQILAYAIPSAFWLFLVGGGALSFGLFQTFACFQAPVAYLELVRLRLRYGVSPADMAEVFD